MVKQPFHPHIPLNRRLDGRAKQGCHTARQIIKATLDHRNARNRCPTRLVICQVWRTLRFPSQECDRPRCPEGFLPGVPRHSGNPEREEKRPGSAHPRRARQEQRAGPASPGLGCNGSARLRDAVTRDHGRDRMFPRHPGGGRSRIRAWAAAAGGPPIVRTDVASRSQAEAPGLPRPAHGRRGDNT
jgi:hypothetical protein